MKKYLVFIVLFLFISGCEGQPKNKVILAKINNYEITKEEFEDQFKESSFGAQDTTESRKAFLEHLINRKLILQEAQAQGLDKEKSFLKSIERFWEQSLLKVFLDNKTKEIAGSMQVSDNEIQEAYNKMLSEGKTDKAYEQMYSQIKWEITRLKESQIMDSWLVQLYKKADIKVNPDLLKRD